MAYNKKYPNINDEILAFDKGQEDRIDNGLNSVIELLKNTLYIHEFTTPSSINTMTDTGVPSEWRDAIVIGVWIKNANNVDASFGFHSDFSGQVKIYQPNRISVSSLPYTNRPAKIVLIK